MINEDLDEIVSIEYIGEEETIDISVDKDRLFYANDILTHNSSAQEVEFDHSHISGGLSKIQTADNVFGIFTSKAMRERGKYQLQFLKTRNSSGVGNKVDLNFNIDTLRITDCEDQDSGGHGAAANTSSMVDDLKRGNSAVPSTENEKPVKVEAESTMLRQFLNNLGDE